jgi:carbon storage regulator
MMVMRRRQGEKILIGDDIVIHIAHIGRNRVKIGIEAPKDVRVVAEEVQAVREENLAAARGCSPEAIQRILSRVQATAIV